METSEAIVLRVYPWSETSCIANLYTREHGKLSLLAKGARRPKSPFEAALDLLSICRVVFLAKSSDALDILTEARLERRFRVASMDLLRLNCGYYVAELTDRLTDKGDQQAEIYDLAKDTLIALENMELEPRAIVLRFELQILRMLGHLPSWQRCVHCGKSISSHAADGEDRQTALHPAQKQRNQTESTSDSWILFSPLAGGVLCWDCRLGGRQLIRIHQTARRVLVDFSGPEWQSIAIDSFPVEHRAAIRKVMERFLTLLLDRQFQLHNYLEELGR